MYVLKKNMTSSAHYPYFVDETEGDRLMSSIDLVMPLVSILLGGSRAYPMP